MKRLLRLSVATVLVQLALPITVDGYAAKPAAQVAGQQRALTIPFEKVNKNIFIKVSVGGAKPVWFVLDTGVKYAVVDLSIAKDLGLDLGDQVQVGGAGKNVVMGNFLKNSPFHVVGMETFSQPLFIALPLDDLARASGHEFAGILGFDFISQFVVQIDYVKKTITFHDKTGFHYHGDGDILPITFNAAGFPLVRAQIVDHDRGPIDGTFVLDTGSGAALILNKPFVDHEELLPSGRTTVPWLEARGFGGSVAGSIGRIDRLKIGRFVIDNPVAVFPQAAAGAFASAETQGNIGAAILEKFNLILDYGRNRLILEPNANFKERIEYNHSGLSLLGLGKDFKRFEVDAVAENSPASEAGIHVGDILAAIAGRPASEYTLSQLRQIFKGTNQCDLTIKRGEQRLQVKLQLRPLI